MDRLDARPKPGESPAESWARAIFAAHEAFQVDPTLKPHVVGCYCLECRDSFVYEEL